MTTFDIRKPQNTITEIRFCDSDNNFYVCDVIRPSKNPRVVGIELCDSDSSNVLVIKTARDADNLIQAIEQAKELGWLK